MLSTPPAFVLSQNQTLKFNFLKPFAFTNNCSNVFLRLFADCFLGCILLYTQMLNWQKHFCLRLLVIFCFSFNSFSSIQFLICIGKRTVYQSAISSIARLLYHNEFCLSSVFSNFFKKNSEIFATRKNLSIQRGSPDECSLILSLSRNFVKRFSPIFSIIF